MDYKEYEKNYNEYERKIRHIVCIFLALETMLLCNFILELLCKSDDFLLLKYHEISLTEFLKSPLFLCGALLVPTIFSYFYSSAYKAYESIRITLAVIIDVMLIPSLSFLGEISYVGILSFLILTLIINIPIVRIIFYQKMLKKYKSSQIPEDDENLINLISKIEKQEQSE